MPWKIYATLYPTSILFGKGERKQVKEKKKEKNYSNSNNNNNSTSGSKKMLKYFCIIRNKMGISIYFPHHCILCCFFYYNQATSLKIFNIITLNHNDFSSYVIQFNFIPYIYFYFFFYNFFFFVKNKLRNVHPEM